MIKSLRFMLVSLLTMLCGTVMAEQVTMKYSGTTTTNMTCDGNEAATLGLNASEWSVTADKGGSNNAPGLNKAGDFRLYGHAKGSNTITVSSLTEATINNISMTFNGTSYNTVTVTVNGNPVTADDEGVYTINSTSFVLGNGTTTQVRIKEVVIDYTPAGSLSDTRTATTISAGNNQEGIVGTTMNLPAAVVKAGETAIDGAVVTWTSSDVEVAKIDGTTLQLLKAGTATITATFEGDENYKPCQDSFTLTVKEAPVNIANIAAATALENGKEFNFTGELLVVAKPTDRYVYVKDATGASLIYAYADQTAAVEVGKTIAANWTGKVSIYNNLFEMVPDAALVMKEGDAVAVEYPEVTPADITAENINKVVTLKGITSYTVDGKNMTISVGENNVVGYNQFGLEIAAAEEGKTYKMVGAISCFKENIQFQPISIEEQEIVKEPIYIETDLTSQFNALTNWQNWTGATGYTATNFCPMVTTNAGQTVQVCEKYEGTCDTTGEIFYQTVTGLTAGTYKIELYGGAAYTFGRGFSSEAFATGTWTAGQHIDENTGVILYAETSEGKYEKEIPIYYATNFPDGAATVVLEGVVIGENGQVKIGMNKTSKSTNWHVIQLKGVTAQVDAVALHATTLAAAQAALDAEANAVITGSERTTLETAITANTTPAEETAEAYKTAIETLNGALTAFNNAKAAYQTLADAKTYAATLTFKYAAAAKKEAAEAAAAAVATNAADATAKTTALYQALRQYAESSALAEGATDATNMTDKIVNPAAEEAVAEPWKTVTGEGSGGSIGILDGEPWIDGSNNATHKYFDGGDWGANAWDVALQQEITLPAGKYQLTAKMRASGDVEQTLFAGETSKAGQSIFATGGLFDRGWNDTSIEFEMAKEGTIAIGVRGVTNVLHNWMSFSDFRLIQLEKKDIPTGINELKAADRLSGNVYNLNGQKVQKSQKGLYIVNGKKVMIK